MPATEPEPENYSIDDIMDRLRTRGEGTRDGEAQLVTRPDGTQVYRMRKRKRRSHQPKKEKEKRQRRMHIGLIVTSVALVVLLALAFVASWFYLNGSAYRDQVTGRVRDWTGAEPKLVGLSMSPVSVGVDSLELKWPEASVLDQLRLGGITGNLDASKLFSNQWQGHELYSANGGQLVLRGAPWEAGPRTAPSGECPFDFRYRASKFSVLLGDPQKPAFLVRDSEATLTAIDPKAGTVNLQFTGGNLETSLWGNFTLSFASLQFEGGKARVGNLRLSPTGAGKGELEIKNSTDLPLDPSGEGTSLDVEIERMPLNELLGSAFGTWFVATVETPDENTPGKLLLRSSEKAGLSLRAPFRSVAGNDPSASGLAMLEVIASQLKDPWYQRPRFETARGELIKDGEIAGVDNLYLETRSRLCLKGRVVAKRDGSLEGTLEVGLPASMVADSNAQMRSLFSKRSGDFMWATIQISGTSHKPLDDLEKRLAGAPLSGSGAAGASGGDPLEESFRELTTPEKEK